MTVVRVGIIVRTVVSKQMAFGWSEAGNTCIFCNVCYFSAVLNLLLCPRCRSIFKNEKMVSERRVQVGKCTKFHHKLKCHNTWSYICKNAYLFLDMTCCQMHF